MNKTIGKEPKGKQMRKFKILGASPCMEPAVKQDDADYGDRAVRECRAYVKAIRKKLGPEPEGAGLQVKAFKLDFGTHYEVICNYDPNNERAANYAEKCDSEAPQTWNEVEMKSPANGTSQRSR